MFASRVSPDGLVGAMRKKNTEVQEQDVCADAGQSEQVRRDVSNKWFLCIRFTLNILLIRKSFA